MKLSEWKSEVGRLYDALPLKLKNYKWKCVFKSVAVDAVLLNDFANNNPLAFGVLESLYAVDQSPVIDTLEGLVVSLDKYYAWRRDDGRWEQYTFGGLKNTPMVPTFVLSYGRPGRNATLNRMERWGEEEVFKNVFVFVQPDQKAEYQRNHPQFFFYDQAVNSVGERMMAVLEFCRHWGIRYAIVLEDDIAEFRHIRKGGVSGNSKVSTLEQEWGSAYLKYFAAVGRLAMHNDRDCVLVGMRNRAMCNNESTSLIGYHDPMRGGCPNMVYFLDVKRFYPIYKTIPREHYSPQYDWAIQCAIVRARKHWVMVTGVVKNEYNSRSVIAYGGDREALAQNYLDYYGVGDVMSYRKFKNTELQGVKIFYSSSNYDETANLKLFNYGM